MKNQPIATKRVRSNFLTLIMLGLLFLSYAGQAQTVFSEVYGFEPRFILPEDDALIIKSVKDFGAAGDGITDDTQAFQQAMASNQRFLYIPAGTYILRDQVRMNSGMKRLFWIGESQQTTIIKLADGSPGFDNPASPKPFIYTIAAGQQGEQNMHNYIQHLTIEIGENNPGAIALNFHTNNTGAVKDVAIKATDPVNHKGFRGIGVQDWGAGPGNLRFIDIDGFQTGIYINEDNHWTLEHVKISNCETGLRSTKATSARRITTINCTVGIHVTGPFAAQELSVVDGPGSGDAVIVGNSNVMIKGLTTAGYTNAINSNNTGDGNLPDGTVEHWLGGHVRHLWDPAAGFDRTFAIPVEESPEYQYPQTPEQWTLISSTGNITAALQAAIDDGAEFIYLQGSTISSTIYVRNKVKKIMVLGEGAITLSPGESNPAFVIQDGEHDVVILEHIYENYGSNNSWCFVQATSRTVVIRHGASTYTTAPEGAGGKVFMESVVGDFEYRGVKAWLRDMNTELGGLDALTLHFYNTTAWVLGQKTEDFATKIKVANGSKVELLGGTYRQNWDLDRVVNRGGIDPDNPVPLFLIEDSHATFAGFTTWGWSGEFPYDPVIREIRGADNRALSRAEGGGSMPLYVGYTAAVPAAQTKGVTGMHFSLQELTVILGQTSMIPAHVLPADATNKKINWVSSDPDVVQVSPTGFVTAVGEGTATVTATTDDGGLTNACVVIVPEYIEVIGINLTPANMEINTGQSTQLTVEILPANATNQSVIWSSDNPDVATVNAEGLITGVSVGQAIITAETAEGGFSATSQVTVNLPPVGGLYAYEGFDYPVGDLAGKDGGIGWSGPWSGGATVVSPGLNVAGVESVGNLTSLFNAEAVREMTETIGETGSVVWIGFILHEMANSPTIHFQLLHDDEIKMAFFRFGYDVWGINSDGTGDPDNLPWQNEKNTHHFWLFKLVFGETNTNITVWRDPNLSVEPTSGGTTISIPAFSFNKVRLTQAFVNGNSDSRFDEIRIAGNFMNATNNDPYVQPTSVTVTPTEFETTKGQTTQLTANVWPANASNKAVTWSTNNAAVATVNTSGLVTAVGAGTATITVTTVDGGFKATSMANVMVPVSGVVIVQDAVSLNKGDTHQLIATLSPDDASDDSVIWSSEDEAIATVSENGLVTAIAKGETLVKVTTVDGDFTATAAITVIQPVSAVEISHTTLDLKIGETEQLSATIIPADANDHGMSWSSDNNAVATVSETGLVTAVAEGTAVVTVTTDDGDFTATCTVVVTLNVGVDETNLADGFVVFPNISQGHVSVRLPADFSHGTIKVFNNAGAEVISRSTDAFDGKLDLSGQPAGVYFIRATSKQFNETRQVIIAR
jgi:uncharacterized protein YjdB